MGKKVSRKKCAESRREVCWQEVSSSVIVVAEVSVADKVLASSEKVLLLETHARP